MVISPQEIMGNSALLDQLSKLNPEQTRDRVRGLTGSQLDDLVANIETDTVPRAFADSQVREALDQRLAQVDVKEETKAKWQELRSTVASHAAEAEEAAEAKFNKELYKKGGFAAVMAVAFTSLLAFFGFKKAKAIKEKGIFRSAIEGTKEHPILAALLAGMGVATGTAAYNYIKHNQGSIVDRVKDEANKTGKPVDEIAHTWGEKLHRIVGDSAEATLPAISMGVATVLGGKYNKETGVVTMPGGNFFYHPAISAYKAGIRRDGGPKFLRAGVSTFVVQRRLEAIIQQTQIVTAGSQKEFAAKKVLAKRATTLMNQGIDPRDATRASNELDRILKTLSPDMKIKASDVIEEVRLRPRELENKLKGLTSEMGSLSKREIPDFRSAKSGVTRIMNDAETKIRNNDFDGDLEGFKKETLRNARERMDLYHQSVGTKKVALASQVEHVMNEIGGVDGKGRAHLDSIVAGRKTQILQGTVTKMEKFGITMGKSRVGGYATKLVMGYMALPLALEGLAALAPGEKGKAAKEALKNDAIEMGSGFIPVAGEIMDFRAAFMGTDLNGRELGTGQRIMAGTMGVLGSASIVAGFFTGGLSVVGFRALRGGVATFRAARFARKVNKGIEVMSAAKALKIAKKSGKNAEVLRNMTKTTNLQRRARKVQTIVRNAQRTVQVVAYGHLGVQLVSGVVNLLSGASGLAESAHKKLHGGIDAAETFVKGHSSA